MKKIAPILIIVLFLVSGYFLFINYKEHRQLRGIRSNIEIVNVIKILDDKFFRYYSLPENEDNLVRIGEPKENHDVDLSDEILEYLNAHRNEWQYEYMEEPVNATNKGTYVLSNFENADDIISTYLFIYSRGNHNWGYYNTTQNHNPLLESISNTLEYQLEGMSNEFWEYCFNTLWRYSETTEEFQNNSYDALITYGKPVLYPEKEFYTSDDATTTVQEITHLGTQHYFQKFASDVGRDVETLQLLWENNKNYFFKYFSKKRYDNLLKPLVDDLINTYNVVTETNAYKKHFKLYDVSDSEFYALPNTAQFQEHHSWSYSFWDRRFSEGNMGYLYEVLLEIEKHY